MRLQGSKPFALYKLRARIFCLLDVGRTSIDGAAFSEALLNECGVALLMGAAFAPELANYVRISLREPEHRLQQAAQCIKDFVATL